MARILRGGIYWADLEPARGHEQKGHRPVLVISHDIFNEKSGTVIALALTSKIQKAGYPLTYKIKESKLSLPSWVKIGQIRTLATERLGKKLGKINEEEISKILEGLFELIG